MNNVEECKGTLNGGKLLFYQNLTQSGKPDRLNEERWSSSSRDQTLCVLR